MTAGLWQLAHRAAWDGSRVSYVLVSCPCPPSGCGRTWSLTETDGPTAVSAEHVGHGVRGVHTLVLPERGQAPGLDAGPPQHVDSQHATPGHGALGQDGWWPHGPASLSSGGSCGEEPRPQGTPQTGAGGTRTGHGVCVSRTVLTCPARPGAVHADGVGDVTAETWGLPAMGSLRLSGGGGANSKQKHAHHVTGSGVWLGPVTSDLRGKACVHLLKGGALLRPREPGCTRDSGRPRHLVTCTVTATVGIAAGRGRHPSRRLSDGHSHPGDVRARVLSGGVLVPLTPSFLKRWARGPEEEGFRPWTGFSSWRTGGDREATGLQTAPARSPCSRNGFNDGVWGCGERPW